MLGYLPLEIETQIKRVETILKGCLRQVPCEVPIDLEMIASTPIARFVRSTAITETHLHHSAFLSHGGTCLSETP